MVDSAKKEFGGSDGGSFGRTIDDFTFTDSQNRRGNTSLPTAAQTGGVSGSDILNAITSIFSPKGENSGRGGWLSAFGQYGGNSDIQMDEFTNPTVTTKYNEKKSSDENAPTTADIVLSNGDVIDNQWFEDNGLLSLYNDVMQTGRYDQSAGSRSMLGLTPDSYAGGNFLQSNSSPFLGQQNAYGSNQGVSYLTADQLNSIDSQNLTSRDGKNVIKYGNMAIPTMAFLERVDPAAYAALADAAEYGSYQY